ncbi:MAG: hypothetical protein NXI31_24580 [bacterium]|nr:hypothetical protein [bacterium]
MIRTLDLLTRGAFLGLAMFAILAHLLLLLGTTVPGWPLPVLLALGWGAANWTAQPLATARPHGQQHSRTRTRAIVALTILVITGTTWILALGATDTPSRFWDGLVTWDVRAKFLTLTPTLEQGYFRDPAVYAHSRDYPVLQPLLIALGNRTLGGEFGRLLFPLLYLLSTATIASTLLRARVRTEIATLAALAFAITPMLVNPTSGGADSGYGELFLTTAMLGAGAGILTRQPIQLAASLVLVVAAKPEGLLYALLPATVAFAHGDRRLCYAGVLGWTIGALAWLPVQYDLNHFGATPPAMLWFGICGVATLALGLVHGCERLGVTPRTRQRCVLVGAPLALLALPLLAGVLGSLGGTLTTYFGESDRAWERLPRLFSVLLGLADHALIRLRFVFAYWAVLLAAMMLWLRRRERPTANALGALLVLGAVTTFVPFLLSPEDDLEHHLRSTMSRLLLHWLGIAWLFVGWALNSAWPDRTTNNHPAGAPIDDPRIGSVLDTHDGGHAIAQPDA